MIFYALLVCLCGTVMPFVGHTAAGCACKAAEKRFFGADAHPLRKSMKCYTECPPSLGRQGALAMDVLWQQDSKMFAAFTSLLVAPNLRSNPGRTQKALTCMGACPLKGIQKFMARFLGTTAEPQVVRATGRLMARNQGGHKRKEHSLLSDVVFQKSFHKVAKTVLRHSRKEWGQFQKNLTILREVHYETEDKRG